MFYAEKKLKRSNVNKVGCRDSKLESKSESWNGIKGRWVEVERVTAPIQDDADRTGGWGFN